MDCCSFSRLHQLPSRATVDTRLHVVGQHNARAGKDSLTALPPISRRPRPAYTAIKTLQTRQVSLILLNTLFNHDPSFTGPTPSRPFAF